MQQGTAVANSLAGRDNALAAAAAAHFWMGWILKCALMSENTKHFKSCRQEGHHHTCQTAALLARHPVKIWELQAKLLESATESEDLYKKATMTRQCCVRADTHTAAADNTAAP
jgi:hypothetical protein